MSTLNDTHNCPDYVFSRRINIHNLNEALGHKATADIFKAAAKAFTGALRLLPGMENAEVQFKNVLERELNPNGDLPDFMILPNTRKIPEECAGWAKADKSEIIEI